jgi:hypothetical protein
MVFAAVRAVAGDAVVLLNGSVQVALIGEEFLEIVVAQEAYLRCGFV